MFILLTVLTALLVLIFVGALVYYLDRVDSTLEKIGGRPNSYLARVGYGVRAIDKETAYLAPQVTQLNEGLSTLATKLGVVNEDLKAVADSLATGKGG